MGRAQTFFASIAIMAARAGIHGGDEHDGCRVAQGGIHPSHGHAAVLQRLAQTIQDVPLEFENFIQKKDTMVGQ
jgi:hypothetical protein